MHIKKWHNKCSNKNIFLLLFNGNQSLYFWLNNFPSLYYDVEWQFNSCKISSTFFWINYVNYWTFSSWHVILFLRIIFDNDLSRLIVTWMLLRLAAIYNQNLTSLKIVGQICFLGQLKCFKNVIKYLVFLKKQHKYFFNETMSIYQEEFSFDSIVNP